jgi:ankyrin repeat protein
MASGYGHEKIVKELLDRGADINFTNGVTHRY